MIPDGYDWFGCYPNPQDAADALLAAPDGLVFFVRVEGALIVVYAKPRD